MILCNFFFFFPFFRLGFDGLALSFVDSNLFLILFYYIIRFD